MISKAKIKWVKALQLKKYRQEAQCFLVQGSKGVQELINSDYQIELIAATKETSNRLQSVLKSENAEWLTATPKELEAMGSFQSNDHILAVAHMKEVPVPVPSANDFVLVLDDIRDPGNLGTIIRTADWFGINKIVASPQTADVYNPKTISATMGSFCRVQVAYTNLINFLSKSDVPVYGAFLMGRNIHLEKFGKGGLVVIGNESNGISPTIDQFIRHRVFIPGSSQAESLNAAIATGIILDNIFRSR